MSTTEATCPVCQERVVVTEDGTFADHTLYLGVSGRIRTCPGSHTEAQR